MINGSPNFESVIFLHVCRNTPLMKSVDDDFFKNRFVSTLYKLTRQFFKNFGRVPFDISNPSTEQIEAVVYRNKKMVMFDDSMSPDENIEIFVNSCRNIIETNYDRYDPHWLKTTIESWVKWENFQKGYRLAIEYQKSQIITAENVKDIIDKSKTIINSRSSIIMDDDIGHSFEDSEIHVQTSPENLINTGFPELNRWLSGNPYGGFEPGTLNILVGEPNVGKSIWLSNLAFNCYVNGFNVLMISVEMSASKIAKRIGSNAFGIPISDYSNYSSNQSNVQRDIQIMKEKFGSDLTPVGYLHLKRFGSASPSDIRSLSLRLERELGLKWHLIVIDYLTELDNDYGTPPDKSYYYHKQNNNDLFNMSVEDNVATLTAHQLSGVAYGSSDITMSMLSESKGITHRTDNLMAIIQTPNMRMDSKYELKFLKPRDGGYKNYRIAYDIDYSHMRLTEHAGMIDPNEI